MAWGAALIAASLESADVVDSSLAINVQEVTAHTLGVGMVDESQYIMQPIISKNSKYPCAGGVLGSTAVPYQPTVNVSVFRGEHRLAAGNVGLGKLHIQIRHPQNETIPVAAVFKLDENGILHFSVVDFTSCLVGPTPPDFEINEFLTNAYHHGNFINVDWLDKLIKEGKLPAPESITIDPADDEI